MIRFIFSIVLVGHGLIHVMGFLKEWKFPLAQNFNANTIIPLSANELKVIGMLWLLCGMGTLFSFVFFLLEKRWWWMVGFVSLVISQSLITLYWHDAKYGSWINLIVLVAVLFSYHQDKFARHVRHEANDLLSSQANKDKTVVTPQSIKSLPMIVQQWLIRSKVIGKEKVHTVHLRQKGMLRTKPDGKWMALEAEQYIGTDIPGFIWNATIDASYFMALNGRDKFKNGHGSMVIKALHTIPVANSAGKEIDQGAMMRYLAEIIWLPSAALSEYIRWEYVNDTSARAIMQQGDTTVSGIFSFDKNGDVIGFEGKRYGDFNDLYSLETWSIAVKGYRDFNDVRIANKSEVTWKLKTGNFTWLQVEVTELDYNIETTIKKSHVAPVSIPEPKGKERKLLFTPKV